MLWKKCYAPNEYSIVALVSRTKLVYASRFSLLKLAINQNMIQVINLPINEQNSSFIGHIEVLGAFT